MRDQILNRLEINCWNNYKSSCIILEVFGLLGEHPRAMTPSVSVAVSKDFKGLKVMLRLTERVVAAAHGLGVANTINQRWERSSRFERHLPRASSSTNHGQSRAGKANYNIWSDNDAKETDNEGCRGVACLGGTVAAQKRTSAAVRGSRRTTPARRC